MTTPGADSFPRADPDAPFAVPEKKINSEADVVRFQRSVGFARFMAFIELLNVAVKGKTCLDEDIPSNPTISRLIELLDVLNGLVDEFPPSTGPRRFGNVAFRTWMGTLDEVPKFVVEKVAHSAESASAVTGVSSRRVPPCTC
jgi:serine/threonine-protein phosphatase 2A activator